MAAADIHRVCMYVLRGLGTYLRRTQTFVFQFMLLGGARLNFIRWRVFMTAPAMNFMFKAKKTDPNMSLIFGMFVLRPKGFMLGVFRRTTILTPPSMKPPTFETTSLRSLRDTRQPNTSRNSSVALPTSRTHVHGYIMMVTTDRPAARTHKHGDR